MKPDQWIELLQRLIAKTNDRPDAWQLSDLGDRWILGLNSGSVVAKRASAHRLSGTASSLTSPSVEVLSADDDARYELDGGRFADGLTVTEYGVEMARARQLVRELVGMLERTEEVRSSFVQDIIRDLDDI